MKDVRIVREFDCTVLLCFSSVLPWLRVLVWSAKASVISIVPQPVQKPPLNWTVIKVGEKEISLATAFGLCVRL